MIKYSLFSQPCLNLGICFSLKQDLQNGYTTIWRSLISQLVRPININILTAPLEYYRKKISILLKYPRWWEWKWQMEATQRTAGSMDPLWLLQLGCCLQSRVCRAGLCQGTVLWDGSGQRRLWGRIHWEVDSCSLYAGEQPLAGKSSVPCS